jgi:hypothetical protein
LENAETLNGILQGDLARITEKPQSLSGGSSSERVSIGTLQEEFDQSIRHHRNLSEQLDNDLSTSILFLILPPVEPEENLSPQEVRQLLEKEHEKTLKAIGIANTAEKRVQELTRVIYGGSPSPPPEMSSSRLEFDDEILGDLGDNTDVSEVSMPDFPSYAEDIGATNDWLREGKARLLRENTYLIFISRFQIRKARTAQVLWVDTRRDNRQLKAQLHECQGDRGVLEYN